MLTTILDAEVAKRWLITHRILRKTLSACTGGWNRNPAISTRWNATSAAHSEAYGLQGAWFDAREHEAVSSVDCELVSKQLPPSSDSSQVGENDPHSWIMTVCKQERPLHHNQSSLYT